MKDDGQYCGNYWTVLPRDLRDYINILHIYYWFMFMRLYTLCISAFVVMVIVRGWSTRTAPMDEEVRGGQTGRVVLVLIRARTSREPDRVPALLILREPL